MLFAQDYLAFLTNLSDTIGGAERGRLFGNAMYMLPHIQFATAFADEGRARILHGPLFFPPQLGFSILKSKTELCGCVFDDSVALVDPQAFAVAGIETGWDATYQTPGTPWCALAYTHG